MWHIFNYLPIYFRNDHTGFGIGIICEQGAFINYFGNLNTNTFIGIVRINPKRGSAVTPLHTIAEARTSMRGVQLPQ